MLLVNLNLIEQAQLLVKNAIAQLRIRQTACLNGLLHGYVKEPHQVSTIIFGLVHGHISTLDQNLGSNLRAEIHAHADTGRTVALMLIELIGITQRQAYLLGHLCRLSDGQLGIDVELVEDDDELVAAHAGHRIGVAQA